MEHLFAVYIEDEENIFPLVHDVDEATARSIRRHFNKLFGRNDTTFCGMVSQTYCLNWQDFI